METLRIITLITACLLILIGYCRFLADESGNVELNNLRFTGGINFVIKGLWHGTPDLFACYFSKDGISSLLIYIGILLIIIAYNI